MTKSFPKVMRFLIFLIILISPNVVFSADGGGGKFQGSIMELDSKNNKMIVNEQNVVWTEKTFFGGKEGSPVTAGQLKVKQWVYVVGIKDKANNRVIAQKIYLIPKYIHEKNRDRYPFMWE